MVLPSETSHQQRFDVGMEISFYALMSKRCRRQFVTITSKRKTGTGQAAGRVDGALHLGTRRGKCTYHTQRITDITA